MVVSEAWWRPRGREVGQKGDSLWALHTSRDREGTLSQSSPSHWLRIIAHGLRVPSRSALTACLSGYCVSLLSAVAFQAIPFTSALSSFALT